LPFVALGIPGILDKYRNFPLKKVTNVTNVTFLFKFVAMGLKIKQIKRSTSGKRIDAVVDHSNFWGNQTRYQIRTLTKQAVPEEEAETVLRAVLKGKSDWMAGKQNRSYPLPDYNGTAFILSETNVEDEEE
jgi:hypothetical protein